MALTNQSPNTGTSLAAQAPDAVAKLWQRGVDIYEQTSDFFQQMEGGSDSVIHTVTDTSKGQGQKITFKTMAGFYDEPHLGEQLFEEQDDFQEILLNTHDLEVDFLRHAVRITDRMEEFLGMRGEIKSNLPVELGKWLGRIKSERLFMMFLHKLNAENTVIAGGKSTDTLVTADTLDYDEIVALGVQLGRMGGQPANVGKNSPLFRNCVVATTDALYSLELDTNYKQVLREAGVRGDGNYIFNGGYTDVRGHIIKQYNPIDHDGRGAVGSVLNPKAFLGTAITAGTATFDIKGGGNTTAAGKTKIKYFKYFGGYAYPFLPNDTLSPANETRYLLIVNPPNAETDPNKIGMYSYTTGNDGHKITITKRLGSAAAGDRVTTLGTVQWNTGVWASKHTDVHPVGSLIVPCNAAGVPFGHSLMLVRGAAYRGYGKYRNLRSEETHEGGFVKDLFVTSVFGQAPRKNADGRCPGAIVLRHALQYAGVPIPTVTA